MSNKTYLKIHCKAPRHRGAFFVGIMMILLNACSKDDKLGSQLRNHQTIDSLFKVVEELNNQEIYDSSTYALSSMALRSCVDIDYWEGFSEALYYKMMNGDWDSPGFYHELEDIREWNIHDSLSNQVLYYLAYLDYYHYRIEKSKKLHEEYVKYCLKNPQERCDFGAFNNLGNMVAMKGDYEKSIMYYQYAFEKDWVEKDSMYHSSYYYRIGLSNYHYGNYDEAIKSLGLARRFASSTELDIPIQMANCYIQLDSMIRAEQLLQQVDAVIEDDSEYLIEYLEASAQLKHKRKDHIGAATELKKAIEFGKIEYGADSRFYGRLVAQLAQYYFDANRLDLSNQTADKALSVFIPNFDSGQSIDNQLAIGSIEEIWIPELLGLKAQIYFSAKRYDLAEAYIRTSIDGFFAMASQYKEDKSKYYLSEYVYPRLEQWIEYLLRDSTKSKTNEIFGVIQRGQSFSLRQSIRQNEALNVCRVDPGYQRELKTLSDSIRVLEEKWADTGDRGLRADLQSRVFELKQVKASLLKELRNLYPNFALYENSTRPVDLEILRSSIGEGELLLQYFYGDRNIYVLSATCNDSNLEKIEKNEELDSLIDNYRKSLSDFDFLTDNPKIAEGLFLGSAHVIYEKLVEPALHHHLQSSEVMQLNIAPSGKLSSISFDALLVDQVADWRITDSYLIDQYSIKYLLTLAQSLKIEENSNLRPGVLGVGLEFTDEIREKMNRFLDTSSVHPEVPNLRGKGLSPLLFAAKEVKEICSLFDGKRLLNDQAKKARFLREAPHYANIHISTHAFVDPSDPLESSLVFSPIPSDMSSAFLSLREIQYLRLNADQIVLSACQTADGPISPGEGVLNLARYFKLAGCHSVISSLWSVPDQISYVLMVEYYKNLKQGMQKIRALQASKQHFLQDDDLSNPETRIPPYWSAFILYEEL